MLNVGIHENLVFSKLERNTHGTLVITVKQLRNSNPIDLLNSSSVSSSLTAVDQQFTIFPPKLDENDTVETILKKIGEVRDPLASILSQYLTSDKIKWELFKNTGITNENINEKLVNESVVNKIYDNIVDQFMTMMTPFVGDNVKKMRMLFVRSSAKKHYPRLRNRFLESQPFIEPMDVPVSKLKFSKYEIDKGLNHGVPVDKPAETTPSDAAEAKSLYA